jgi:predicted phage terminase large subunit-like protein
MEKQGKELLAHKMLCSSSTLSFTRKMFEFKNKSQYIVGEHHKKICDALDAVIAGKTRKLIINIAPRYGKTLLVAQMFIACGLAINAKSKFLHLSYSGSLAQDNSVAIKEIVENDYYKALFETRIKIGSNTKSYWSTEQGGGVYATTTLGQITGFGAGVTDAVNDEMLIDEFTAKFNPDKFAGAIVIDDPIKPEDALSDNQRESVNRRFETTIRNRVNSRKTPIIIIMQRLHEHDLCGYLQEIEPDEWTVLSLPCIYEDEETGEERALWDFKHTLEELRKLRDINPFVFETQYMQNPKPLEGLLYNNLRTYDVLPIGKYTKKNYTDTADTGSDFLCSICYNEYKFGMYITDIVYTKKPMEYTEVEVPRMLNSNGTEYAIIESNNGGRAFARNVEKNVRELGNKRMEFKTFTQSLNKQSRIYSHSAEVQNLIFFPSDWEKRWPEFARDVKGYRKEGSNANDDAPDVLTGMTEYFGEGMNTMSSEEILSMLH